MTDPVSRRDALKQLGILGTGFALGGRLRRTGDAPLVVAGRPVELSVTSLGPRTVRITVRAITDGGMTPAPATGELTDGVATSAPLRTARTTSAVGRVRAGTLTVTLDDATPAVHVADDVSGSNCTGPTVAAVALTRGRASGAVVASSTQAASESMPIADSGRTVIRFIMVCGSPRVERSRRAAADAEARQVVRERRLVRPRFDQRFVAPVSPFGTDGLAVVFLRLWV